MKHSVGLKYFGLTVAIISILSIMPSAGLFAQKQILVDRSEPDTSKYFYSDVLMIGIRPDKFPDGSYNFRLEENEWPFFTGTIKNHSLTGKYFVYPENKMNGDLIKNPQEINIENNRVNGSLIFQKEPYGFFI